MQTDCKMPRVLIRRFDFRSRRRGRADLASPQQPARVITLCATGLFALLVASTSLPAAALDWTYGVAGGIGAVLVWQLGLVLRRSFARRAR